MSEEDKVRSSSLKMFLGSTAMHSLWQEILRAPTLRLDDVTADEVCMQPHTFMQCHSCHILSHECAATCFPCHSCHSCQMNAQQHFSMSFPYWQDLVTPPPRSRDLDEKATGTPPAIVTPYAKIQLAAFKRAEAASKNVLWQHVKT